MKTNNLQVKLLSRYYLITALASAFITEEQKAQIFDTLRRIYCLPDDTELEEYRALSEREPYGTMTTLADYDRECRVIEYSSLVGKAIPLTDADRVVLAAKGEALRDKQAIVDYGANFTKDALREQLAEASAKGNVHALGVLALLDTYGFGMGTNPRRAERLIEKAERWNDIDVILLSAELHPERGEELVRKLATVFRGDADSDILTAVAEKCGVAIPQETDNCSFLMERAFQRGAVERGVYDGKFASFIYTEVIRYEDKARIIDNYKKESAPLYDDIPTHINMSDVITVDFSALEGLTLQREGEVRKIRRNLITAHTRRNKFYKPLLLECRDEYVISMYKQAIIGALSSIPVVKLDASLLTAQDLSQTKDNIFLRSVSDSGRMSTAFVIENCHMLSEGAGRELSKYIRGDVRSTFRLNYPQVTVDLSPCLIILLGEGEVTEQLADMCDVVRIAMPTGEEKEAVVRAILDYRRTCYGLDSLEVSESVMKSLVAKSSALVSDLADEFAKYLACDPTVKEIDDEALANITKELNRGTVKFGF